MKTSVLGIVAALVLGALRASGHTGFHAITTAHGNGAESHIHAGSVNANYGTET
jgi:type IV secretory pathway ATPase VirB11/archaellum biosynthesis ATPase